MNRNEPIERGVLMGSYVVNGGRRLSGSIKVQGSKNSALPILAATYLVGGVSVIHNCPRLSDTPWIIFCPAAAHHRRRTLQPSPVRSAKR